MRSSSVAPFGIGDGGVPADDAGGDVEREQVAAGRADEQAAARDDAARVVAHDERRGGALVDPLARAVGRVQRVHAAVAGEHDDDAVGDARRRDDLGGHARRPRRLAVGDEGEHVALVGADDDQRRVGADAGGELLAGA